jgi:tetratricopeptide (TPR) repeat protein
MKANAAAVKGAYEDAELNYVKSVRMAIEGRCDPPSLITPAMALASVYKKQARYVECEKMLMDVRRAVDKIPGASYSAQAVLANNIADLYVLLGRYPEAVTVAKESVDAGHKLLFEKDIRYVIGLTTLAEAYFGLGQFAESSALCDQVLAATEGRRGFEGLAAQALIYLARMAEGTGKYSEAESLARHARNLVEQSEGPRREELGAVLRTLARIARTLGKADDALPLCKQALEIDLELFGERHPASGRDLHEYGEIYRAKHDDRGAELSFQKALLALRRALPASHPDVTKTVQSHAALLRSNGRDVEAMKLEELFRPNIPK